jgi:hypothetical protein
MFLVRLELTTSGLISQRLYHSAMGTVHHLQVCHVVIFQLYFTTFLNNNTPYFDCVCYVNKVTDLINQVISLYSAFRILWHTYCSQCL